jgi:hypothetical protein
MTDGSRDERLQIMLTQEELILLDDFRFKGRMPSRAAAVRELLKRGLAALATPAAGFGRKSSDYGVGEDAEVDAKPLRIDGKAKGKNKADGKGQTDDR